MLAADQDFEEVVRRGIECCRRDDWDRGLYYLGQVAQADHRSTALPGLFYSYLGYGIARCQRRVQEGLKLCRHSIKVQFYETENYLNLARTCLLANERTEAIYAVLDGLKVDPQSLELQALHRELGIRRRPVLGFLSRRNPLNLLLGRVRALFTPLK